MSIPIPFCHLKKAYHDEGAFKTLVSNIAYNLKFGCFSFWPCEHDPICLLTEEQTEELMLRLIKAIEEGINKNG